MLKCQNKIPSNVFSEKIIEEKQEEKQAEEENKEKKFLEVLVSKHSNSDNNVMDLMNLDQNIQKKILKQ